MAKQIKINIKLGNDSMQTAEDAAELLQQMARQLLANGWDAKGNYRDSNGNTCAVLEIK